MTDAVPQGDVAAHLAEIRRRVATAAATVDRPPEAITLVAVSKAQPLERIEQALAAGHRIFGENYVQEAVARWPRLRERTAGIELHLIGALQSNKARDAVRLFDVIQTLDRHRLAEALAREAQRAGHCPRLLIQVNTGAEAQKAGIMPDAVDGLVELARARLGLPIEGFMAIPPEGQHVGLHTRLLATLAARHGLPVVSCGMSADFEQAIRHGATHVRVGSAIFGERARRRG
jgi:pyridoxal phosphate enzyme (YggS family)